jgi:hypothetical protein
MSQGYPHHAKNSVIINAQAMTGNITSEVENTNNINRFSIHVFWSGGGTPIGSLILQASNDGSNFVDVETNTVTGNSGGIMYNVEGPSYSWVRVKYSFTSGSATMSAIFNSKY